MYLHRLNRHKQWSLNKRLKLNPREIKLLHLNNKLLYFPKRTKDSPLPCKICLNKLKDFNKLKWLFKTLKDKSNFYHPRIKDLVNKFLICHNNVSLCNKKPLTWPILNLNSSSYLTKTKDSPRI